MEPYVHVFIRTTFGKNPDIAQKDCVLVKKRTHQLGPVTVHWQCWSAQRCRRNERDFRTNGWVDGWMAGWRVVC